MTIEARAFQPGEVGEIRSPNSKTDSAPTQAKKEVFTHKEIVGYLGIEPFTLEEALLALGISELEFQDQLHSRGICKKDDFDRNGKFPVEWIDALDTGEWKLYKI